MIGIYFSAHWCGPCRNFTPKLVEKYESILEEGHNFEIIFSSSDEDEEQALDYFKTMPWKMISYSDREFDEGLSRKFEIRGIPTLVLLDEEGNLITTDGRDVLMNVTNFNELKSFVKNKKDEEEKEANELALLKESFKLTTFFKEHHVVDKDNKVIDIESLLRDSKMIVGLYFSAHWCPPCRAFTPLLSDKYASLIKEGHPFEIIFISSDRDVSSALEYYQEMPWKMLNYEDRNAKLLLGEVFNISGIPSLVLIDNDGIITKDGREAIMTTSFDQLKAFEEDKRKQEEMLLEKIALMPIEITHSSHEQHVLKKLATVYRGQYGCDICHGSGKGWVYHCDECGFDAHPLCACPEYA